jgi:hypothetical protein
MKFLATCALLLAPLACADEPAKAVKIDQLMIVMNIEQQQKQMMGQMSQMVIGQIKDQMAKQGNVSPAEMEKMEDREKRLFALIADKTSWQHMKPVYIKAYADTFTESDIDGILAFYKSPPGKAMIDKQPALNGKIMENVQAQMADLMPQIEQIMK